MANFVANTQGASLAVNHPQQAQPAAASVVHEASTASFVSDAVTHGTESLQSVASAVASAPLAGWALVPGTSGTYIPASGNPNAVPGSNPSYVQNPDGSYTFSGNSGSGTSQNGPTLSAAITAWVANNTGQGQSTSNATAAGTSTTTTTDPFSQLIGLVNSGALSVPSVSTDAESTAPTVAQGTGSPDMTLPLILFLLAGVAVWWWWKHKHHKAAA